VTAAAVVLTSAGAGSAHSRGDHRGPLVDGLAGPLSIDVTHRGDVLVGQAFAGIASLVSKRGDVTDLVTEPGVSAVAEGPWGSLIYTIRTDAGDSLVKIRSRRGSTRVLADLGAYEASANPDAGNVYGVPDISDECAAQWPVADFGPPTYPGQIDSNPYALATSRHGVYVADSGGNAILFVDWWGHVRTVAVLPPQPLVIPDDPTGLGLPACVAGLTYYFEPVPTDIELSRRGAIVSLLPGGPEDASLGARGSVVKVDLRTGSSQPIATGILGATDVAVSSWGTIYVTELFGGRVLKVTRSGLETVAELPDPAAVEWSRGRLYVAYDVFGSGKITTLRG
jgi:hypothetical protein